MKSADFVAHVLDSLACRYLSSKEIGTVQQPEPHVLRVTLEDGDTMVLRCTREAGDPCTCGLARDECQCDELQRRRSADLDSAFAQLEDVLARSPVDESVPPVLRFLAPSGRGVKIDTRTMEARYL